MIFDDMRHELKELLELVRRDEQYCAAVMSGDVAPCAEAGESAIDCDQCLVGG